MMSPDFVLARPSWLSGAARSLDLMGQFDAYNESPDEELADRRALLSDWRALGETLLTAMRSFGREQSPTAE